MARVRASIGIALGLVCGASCADGDDALPGHGGNGGVSDDGGFSSTPSAGSSSRGASGGAPEEAAGGVAGASGRGTSQGDAGYAGWFPTGGAAGEAGSPDPAGGAGEAGSPHANGGEGGAASSSGGVNRDRLLSSLDNREAEQLCNALAGVEDGRMADETWRRCLVPLTYRAVCNATVGDYSDCFSESSCEAFDTMCPQVLDAPNRPRGAWAEGEVDGAMIEWRWGNFQYTYDYSGIGNPVSELFALSTFERNRIEVFGSVSTGEYHGLFALPSAPARWLCAATVNPVFAYAADLSTGGAVPISFSGSGLSRLPECGPPSGAAWHRSAVNRDVEFPEPVCDDVLCRTNVGLRFGYAPFQELLLFRLGGDDPPLTEGTARTTLVTTQVIKLASSLLVEPSGLGRVICGGGGTFKTVRTSAYEGDGLTPRTTFSYSVDLDWMASDDARTCPGIAVDGSWRSTYGELE